MCRSAASVALALFALLLGCQQILGDYTVEDDCQAALDRVHECVPNSGGNCSGFDDCQLQCFPSATCSDIQQSFAGNYNTALGSCLGSCN